MPSNIFGMVDAMIAKWAPLRFQAHLATSFLSLAIPTFIVLNAKDVSLDFLGLFNKWICLFSISVFSSHFFLQYYRVWTFVIIHKKQVMPVAYEPFLCRSLRCWFMLESSEFSHHCTLISWRIGNSRVVTFLAMQIIVLWQNIGLLHQTYSHLPQWKKLSNN